MRNENAYVLFLTPHGVFVLFFPSETHVAIQRKADRMERMRDDPFYLGDDRPAAGGKVEDMDAIPVVRLDDMPPLPQPPGESSRQVPCRKALGS